ncbi:TAR DNA-binding protein 43-like isoform X2 [Convolutriloba macropyga]|uniref:TAR DNA-binding protein 43-like isoform X2 n=1 Tax=Convolutriloba macropyga TaxID=536237 RepID=UPI003F51DF77
MSFMDNDYILVASHEKGEPVEVTVESDGTVLFSSIQSQFPKAIGIKFRNPATRAFRAVKLCDNVLHPPNLENGWGQNDIVYVVNTAEPVEAASSNAANTTTDAKLRKRDASGDIFELSAKANAKRILSSLCTDLIVLNLPYDFDVDDLKRKFEEFGELSLCEIKKDSDKKSRGYGFIRYISYEDQRKVQGRTFNINGRQVEVKKPNDKNAENNVVSARVFVGQLDESISKIELMEYFEQFGDINSSFYQVEKRYAFVEFDDPAVARAVLLERSHFIKNKHIVVRTAEPRNKSEQVTSGDSFGEVSRHIPVRDRLGWGEDSRGIGATSGSYSSYQGGNRDGPAGGSSFGEGGSLVDSEALFRDMAKMMAEAVSQQLSQHFGNSGSSSARNFYGSNSR